MTILKELELQKGVQDSIIEEYNKLKPSKACIIGDVVAVMKRSDEFLDKPESLINHDNDNIYVVFEPTKLAKVCGVNLDVICNKNSIIKFIPVETLFFRLFEFNFLYTQMVLNNDTWISVSEKYKTLFSQYAGECIEDVNFKLKYKKEATIAYCVWQDIMKGKFKKTEQIFDRFYLITYLLGRLTACDCREYRDMFMRCYKNGEIDNEAIETINKLNGINLNRIESFNLKEIEEDAKVANYKKTYKLLTGEEA